MSRRKPRPATVYREEVLHADGRPGSTRQTFDPAQYAAWQRLKRQPGDEVRFYVGVIDWSEEAR